MKKTIYIIFILIFLSSCAETTTRRYRLTLRDNPATSIVIGWEQISGSDAIVYYGPTDYKTKWRKYPSSAKVSRSVVAAGMENKFARLTNLQPNTSYYFVIKDSEGKSKRFWFKTAPNMPNDRLAIIAGGDSRNNRDVRINGNLLVAKLKPHAVLFGGDMTNNDTNEEWQNWLDDWQSIISSDGRMYAIVVARGNHENSNTIVVDIFDVPNEHVFYDLRFGGNLVRVYSLNTQSHSQEQTIWLTNQLSTDSTSKWKIAQYHRPMRPHNFKKSENNRAYNNWAQLFYDYGVNLAVECDAHTAKTTWPVKPFQGNGSDEGFIRDDERGTVYIGEGGWGAPLRDNDDDKSWTRNSGKFNQFNWIFIDQKKIEIRKIKIDNAMSVGENSNDNPFNIPKNLDIWDPSNGSVIIINKN